MKHLSSVIILFLLSLTSISVQASDVQVRVFERGGKEPLSGVAVCLGTPARIGQFGAKLTDGSGSVMFNDVPMSIIQITASKGGYMAEQKSVGAASGKRLLVITLPTGGGGVQCPLDMVAAQAPDSSMSVSRFTMSNGAAVATTRNVTLNNTVSGKPTQYRASESSNFKDAAWQTYAKAPVFQLSAGQGRKTVYFQVRRHATLGGANLETLSPIRKDTIRLQ